MGANVGDPETIVPELILWSFFVASSVFQLSLAPTTFLNYCFVTSVEEFVKKGEVKKTVRDAERAAEEMEEMNGDVMQEAALVNMGLTDRR